MSRSRNDGHATHRAALEQALQLLSAHRAELVDFAAARMESRSRPLSVGSRTRTLTQVS